MKFLVSVFLMLTATSVFAASKQAPKNINMCDAAAKKEVNTYFDSYYEQRKSEEIANLEKGATLDEDLLPGGLDLFQEIDGVYSYSWGEMSECSCGVDVNTTPSKDGKSCEAKVDEKSQSCDCG